MKFYNENPTISDVVAFDLKTTDANGDAVDPYKVNQIIIYFIERGFTVENVKKYTKQVGESVFTEYFKDAVPVDIFGDDSVPAWLSADTSDAFITKLDFDDDGNPLTGVFRLEWTPKLVKEGDYLLCYNWTPIVAGDVLSQNIQFYLFGNTKQTTSIPTHFTVPDKYEVLLERYLPEMFKMFLAIKGIDLTPDVLERFNNSVAKGFTTLEDLANQIVDLIDANAVSDVMLPYLANLFGMRLKSSDIALWRRQIKTAIPLYKKKGTIGGLKEALASADIQFKKLTKLWQVVSKSTWQEGFIVTESQAAQSTPIQFILDKVAVLPTDDNFELYLRLVGQSEYQALSLDYVTFENSGTGGECNGVANGTTTMTWVGDQLSISPIILAEGDVVRIVYKIAEPPDQSIEDYIRTLPLSDQRDETSVTYPQKNWNVRLIAEDDSMFDVIIPSRHPFHYPLVYGKIRTEFPYSENIYNMEEYNAGIHDSTNPCDIDKDFLDSCTACQSSKFIIDVEIEDLSADRLEETEEIIKDFVPFHAIVHTINYSGSKNEFIPSPAEEVEILATWAHTDNVISTQMNFNRLIEDGTSDANELKRNMLASYTSSAESGTGYNVAIVMFSPGVQFNTLGISDNNYLEILSGTDQGEYKVSANDRFMVDIVQGMPDTITWPLDVGQFPFRLSNVLYEEVSASVYQDDVFVFSDDEVTFVDYGTVPGWKINITSGPHAGSYVIADVNSNNTLNLVGFPTTATQSGLSYEIRTDLDALRFSGTSGVVTTTRRGRVEIDLVAIELGFRIGDYVGLSGTQYRIIRVEPRGIDIVDKVYIEGYTGGDVVGVASVTVYRRLLDSEIGYLGIRGMKLTGVVPVVDGTVEDNTFRENYLIQIGLNYYQIASIDGSDMILNGPLLEWGLTGTAVSYSILHFTKTSPITSQAGNYQGDAHVFDRLDRRGNESYVIETETQMPMFMTATVLNSINESEPNDFVSGKENIWFEIERR